MNEAQRILSELRERVVALNANSAPVTGADLAFIVDHIDAAIRAAGATQAPEPGGIKQAPNASMAAGTVG